MTISFLFIFKSSTTNDPTQDVFYCVNNSRLRSLQASMRSSLSVVTVSKLFIANIRSWKSLKRSTMLADIERLFAHLIAHRIRKVKNRFALENLFSDARHWNRFPIASDNFSSRRSNFANKSNCYAILSRPDRMHRVGRANVSIRNWFSFLLVINHPDEFFSRPHRNPFEYS